MEVDHYKKTIIGWELKENIMPDKNILFNNYYNNTCLIVILTIIQ